MRDHYIVGCGLTACTPRSAPDPALGNEYGKILPFTLLVLENSACALAPLLWLKAEILCVKIWGKFRP